MGAGVRQIGLDVLLEFAERQQRWGEHVSALEAGRAARRRLSVLNAQAAWRAKNREKMRRDWHEKYSPRAAGGGA